jgi:excisionase family DNA binding protein
MSQDTAPRDPAKSGVTHDRYLTMAEVAGLLALSRAAAYRLADDVTFPATRVGKAMRVEPAALERWLAAHTQRSKMRP